MEELRQADKIDWSRSAADSTKSRAVGGGDDTGRNPTDRGQLGTKHNVLTDAQGIPLTVTVTGANVADVTQLLPLVDGIPDLGGEDENKRNKPKGAFPGSGAEEAPLR